MKLERCGDWVRWPYAKTCEMWVRPVKIIIANVGDSGFRVSLRMGVAEDCDHDFHTEAEAQAFAREIMEGKE